MNLNQLEFDIPIQNWEKRALIKRRLLRTSPKVFFISNKLANIPKEDSMRILWAQKIECDRWTRFIGPMWCLHYSQSWTASTRFVSLYWIEKMSMTQKTMTIDEDTDMCCTELVIVVEVEVVIEESRSFLNSSAMIWCIRPLKWTAS